MSKMPESPRAVAEVNFATKLVVPERAPESVPQEKSPVSDQRSLEVAAVSQSVMPAPEKWRETTRLVVEAPAPQSPSVLAPKVEVALGAWSAPPTLSVVRMVADAAVSSMLPTKRFCDVEKYVDDASPVIKRSLPMLRFCVVERYVDEAFVMVPAVAESAVVEAYPMVIWPTPAADDDA